MILISLSCTEISLLCLVKLAYYDDGPGQSWSAHIDLAVVVGANGVDSKGSTGHVARRVPGQVIPGASIDAAIGKLAVEAMTPMALEVALAVWQES